MPDTYSVGVLNSTPAANRVHLSLHNASALPVKIHKVIVGANPQAAVAGMYVPLRVARYIAAAPTTGTAVVPSAHVSTAPALAGITVKTNPTAPTGEEVPFGVGAINTEETGSQGQLILYQHLISGPAAFTLLQGQGIVVRQHTLASAGALDVVVTFTVG